MYLLDIWICNINRYKLKHFKKSPNEWFRCSSIWLAWIQELSELCGILSRGQSDLENDPRVSFEEELVKCCFWRNCRYSLFKVKFPRFVTIFFKYITENNELKHEFSLCLPNIKAPIQDIKQSYCYKAQLKEIISWTSHIHRHYIRS